MFEVFYHEEVLGVDLPCIDKNWQSKIKQSIEAKLTTGPELYGKPLRRGLKNYRKLRVGDYRIIFRIDGRQVKIFVIQHRSRVYGKVSRRLSR